MLEQREWIRSQEWRQFLQQHLLAPSNALLLKYASKGEKYRFFCAQIAARQQSKNKFPEAFHQPEIIFPSLLAVEQTSSFRTAAYKAAAVSPGETGIDLTGGFGIDTYFLSKKFEKFTYAEQQSDLAAIAQHNFAVLGLQNVHIAVGDSLEYIKKATTPYDLVYADPARRKLGARVFGFDDCAPNINQLLPQHQYLGKNWLVKGAPMLDVHQLTQKYPRLSAVHIVAMDGECKEVLVQIETPPQSLVLKLADLTKNDFTTVPYLDARAAKGTYALPQAYLYEPSVAWMKAGLYNWLSLAHNTHQLHNDTHIYTSSDLIETFPGQAFKFIEQVQLKKGKVPNELARIISKNHPATSEELRKKLGVGYGGNKVLFAVKNLNQAHVGLLAEQISFKA